MTKLNSIKIIALLYVFLQSVAYAQKPDKPNTQDHPLLSRFEGFSIDAYQERQFDRYELPLGPSISDKTLGEHIVLEGKVTQIFYVYSAKPAPSLLQLYKSYEQALNAQDVEILFACFKSECGTGATDLVRTSAHMKRLLNGFMAFGEHAYIAAKTEQNGTDIHVGIYLKDERGNVAYELAFVESESMNTGNISLAEIDKGIDETGKQAFYGLYFDSGKSRLTSASEDALTLLAQYLSANSGKRYFIVGHTDNSGSYEANISLSLARANAVIDALDEQHNIDVTNLTGIGIGPVSPVASNAGDSGKALNRRVELVLR